jgi:hypothetical protein
MNKLCLKMVLAAASLLVAVPMLAQRSADLKPSEQVWVPAPTPQGGVSWAVLESTREIQRTEAGIIYSMPNFSSAVKALSGTRIKVNGYIMPLQSSVMQTHFVLLGYPPDCPFHLNPAPTQFIEVRASTPVPVYNENQIRTIEGTLVLGGDNESGIFYQLVDGQEL